MILYKKGGIHIKPENRGKFTASAKHAGMGVQEFAGHVLANKEDYSTTQIKRANFARNSTKFKH
jgi:Zn-dependent oligopeptidase